MLPLEYVRSIIAELPQIISELHAVDGKIWVWNVNSVEDAKLVEGFGLDAVGTYRIDRVVKSINQH